MTPEIYLSIYLSIYPAPGDFLWLCTRRGELRRYAAMDPIAQLARRMF